MVGGPGRRTLALTRENEAQGLDGARDGREPGHRPGDRRGSRAGGAGVRLLDHDHEIRRTRRLRLVRTDLSSRDSIAASVARLDGTRIDILVNNAGVFEGGLLERHDVARIYELIQSTLTGPMHLTRLLLPGMLARRVGKIVNHESINREGRNVSRCSCRRRCSTSGHITGSTGRDHQDPRGAGRKLGSPQSCRCRRGSRSGRRTPLAAVLMPGPRFRREPVPGPRPRLPRGGA